MSQVNNDRVLTAPPTANRPTARNTSGELDRDAFLTLLITQLQHQDPLNPMDDTAFVAQLAQFSALEQMQNLNSTFNRQASFSMIGQWVFGFSRHEGTGALTEVSGVVDSVRVINNEPWLVIGEGENERTIRMADVQHVEDTFFSQHLLNEIATGMSTSQNVNLVGRYVQALALNSQGQATGFVEGRVEFIDFTGSVPLLVIGNNRVDPRLVTAVSDAPMIIGQEIGFFNGAEQIYGRIDNVRFVEGRPELRIINNYDGQAHYREVDRINFVMEALRMMQHGTPVNFEGQTGQITHVFANAGAVWVRIDGGPSIQYALLVGAPITTPPATPDNDSDGDNNEDAPTGSGDDE